jgi:hypothetical protein
MTTTTDDPAYHGQKVWMAAARKGIDYHNLTRDAAYGGRTITMCGGSTRTGVITDEGTALTYDARRCPRCVWED